jgi:hypothetical protein
MRALTCCNEPLHALIMTSGGNNFCRPGSGIQQLDASHVPSQLWGPTCSENKLTVPTRYGGISLMLLLGPCHLHIDFH